MTSPDHVELADGRRIDCYVSGPDGGLPLVFHHGTPGARPPARAIERAAHARGLRFVTYSRPGYGDSTPLPGRSVADAVSDTRELLEAIGASRCVVAGWSGGGPHALACAARLEASAAALVIAGLAPYRVEGLDWSAGMGEDNVVEFEAALAGEASLRVLLEDIRSHLAEVTVEGIITSLASLLPEVDRAVLTDEFGEDVAEGFHEALRVGIEGWVEDDLCFVSPWGFELEEIKKPVAIWQGALDLMVPFAHGKWLASAVPGAVTHLEEGEGHLSVGIGAIGEMLDELVAAAG